MADGESVKCPRCRNISVPVGEFCPSCCQAILREAYKGFADMETWMRNHLSFTDFLIEHGISPTD